MSLQLCWKKTHGNQQSVKTDTKLKISYEKPATQDSMVTRPEQGADNPVRLLDANGFIHKQVQQTRQQGGELRVVAECNKNSGKNPVDCMDTSEMKLECTQQSKVPAPQVQPPMMLPQSLAPPRSSLCQKQVQWQSSLKQSQPLDPSVNCPEAQSFIDLGPESEINPSKQIAPENPTSLTPCAKEIEETSEDGAPSSALEAPEHVDNLEDEFDFAILLKPSKYEEKVDFQDPRTNPFPTDFPNDRALILNRIRATGLQLKRLLSLDGKQSLLKVRAPQRVLEVGAERLRLRKRRRFDHVWMVFTCPLRSSFADFDAKRQTIHFLDSEKQRIVHALLTAPERDGGAGLNECCALAARYVVQMYPLHKQDLALLQTRWVTFWRPLLLSNERNSDFRTGRVLRNLLQQPLDDVAQYYGERVAFYFAWMELYTQWLVVPSVAGVLLFSLQLSSHQLDHPAAPVYALLMTTWTSFFILAWRRRAAGLAYHWGTWGYEDEEVTRPEFYGQVLSSNEREGKDFDRGERYYALWKRAAKYSVTFPCVAISIGAVVALAYSAFSTRDRLEANSLATKHEASVIAAQMKASGTITLEELRALAHLGVRWDFWIYLLLTPLLYGLLIPVLDAAFTRAARGLNQWENHRTESRYQSHLILKVFSFRFVHVFASLYYSAFAPHAASGATPSSNNMVRVAIQLASFMVTGQLWKNVMETVYPFVRRRLDARAKKRASNAKFQQSTIFNKHTTGPARPRGTATLGDAILSSNAMIHAQCVRLEQASDQAWEEAGLKPYDTFEDYTEMLVQFGYVSCFSLAFPLAPVLALVNNVLELRTDAFKLCHTRQRPLAHKASGIGVWLHVLQVMSVLAVLTNCFQLAYSTSLFERAFPDVTPTHKVWLVFGIEHVLLLLQVWLACAVPSVPRAVAAKLRRERELAKHESARTLAARWQE